MAKGPPLSCQTSLRKHWWHESGESELSDGGIWNGWSEKLGRNYVALFLVANSVWFFMDEKVVSFMGLKERNDIYVPGRYILWGFWTSKRSHLWWLQRCKRFFLFVGLVCPGFHGYDTTYILCVRVCCPSQPLGLATSQGTTMAWTCGVLRISSNRFVFGSVAARFLWLATWHKRRMSENRSQVVKLHKYFGEVIVYRSVEWFCLVSKYFS